MHRVCRLAICLFGCVLLSAIAFANSIDKYSQQRGKTSAVALTSRAIPAPTDSSRRFAHNYERTFAEPAAARNPYALGDASCGFSRPCYWTVLAPEPQSLLLVGSGLITMAGLIRRRFAR